MKLGNLATVAMIGILALVLVGVGIQYLGNSVPPPAASLSDQVHVAPITDTRVPPIRKPTVLQAISGDQGEINTSPADTGSSFDGYISDSRGFSPVPQAREFLPLPAKSHP